MAKDLGKAGFDIVRKKEGLFVAMHWLQHYRTDFPTSHKKVRQALVYAINKKEIVDQILMGMGDVATSATTMLTWAIEYKPYHPSPFDPELAKKLLAEAGYPDGFQMYIYSFVNKLPEAKLINLAIASYWENIGVKTKVLEMDYMAFKPHWTKQKDPVGPSAFLFAFPNRPVMSYRTHHYSGAMYSHQKDSKLDRLIENFEAQKTQEGYISAAREAMDYIMEMFYTVGICTTDEIYMKNENVPEWNMGKGVGAYRWAYIGT
jgi:ABC-type transport system substrate-binding protein